MYNDSTSVVEVSLQWCDISTNYMINAGESKIISASGSRIYDSIYSFIDIELTTDGASILARNPRLEYSGATSQTIKTSVDGGSTWQTATNGGAIPNLPANPTILDVRQTLETTDTTVTPRLESLEVDIDTAVVNEDTGNITGSETKRFTLSFNDSGVLSSVEDNSPLMVSQQDSGYFNADAENFYTMVFEAVDKGKLISDVEYNQEGWITNPKNTSQWKKVDENKENLWTKVEKNTADWKKVGGE